MLEGTQAGAQDESLAGPRSGIETAAAAADCESGRRPL